MAVIVSVIFTAWAAIAASNAAKAAKESVEDARADAEEQSRRFGEQLAVAQASVKVAEETLDHARDRTVKELRAYIDARFISSPELEGGNVVAWLVGFTYENFGKTPAYEFTTGIAGRLMQPAEIDAHDFEDGIGPPVDGEGVFLPAGIRPSTKWIRITLEELELAAKRERHQLLWTKATYKDAFSDDWREFARVGFVIPQGDLRRPGAATLTLLLYEHPFNQQT
jgi:hypothetical protein